MRLPEATYTVALAGQPNVGKSTVFNALTGQNQYVSNWPGKTCEQKSGIYQQNGLCLNIVDLPGAYSLTANSVEEQIARDFLITCRPDVMVAVVDAASLERNLYLVAELLCLPVPLVLGVNMLDMAGEQGIIIETHVLEAAMGVPVVPMVASRGEGMRELAARAAWLAANPAQYSPKCPNIQDNHRTVLAEIQTLIARHVPEPYPPDWIAIKLLEGDAEVTEMMRRRLKDDWEAVNVILVQHDDAFLAVASGRYEWIGRMMRAAVVNPRAGQVTTTDRLDRFATHPVWGLFILLGLVGLLFALTYAIGTPLQLWLEMGVVQPLAEGLRFLLSGGPAWLSGLLADGVVTGVGTVLTLLPILVIFFAVLGLLEDVGYMARAAFVMDRFMHLMGLHGKSFLPMFLGFGCNVPALMGARVIEAPKARLITLLVTPLVPCTARLSVIALLTPIFFGPLAMWITLGLVLVTLLVAAALGMLLHRLLLGREQTAFIMELPLYHRPSLQGIGQGVWQRTLDFLQGAGTIILVVSVLMWALSTYPGGDIETSLLSTIGRWMSPLGDLMGMEWRMMVALLASFVRKENTIPTLAVLYGAGQDGGGLAAVLGGRMLPAAALAFLTTQMLFIPCIATVATLRQETGSWRWTLASVAVLLVISLLTGIAIYQGGRLLGWGV